jgi:uncharacterized protein (TIGR02246 family)
MNSSAATLTAADEDAIRAIHQCMIDAWNAADGAAFAAPFTEDADFVAFEGTHLTGRRAIAWFHRRVFDTIVAGTRLEGEVKFVRPLGRALAAPNSDRPVSVGTMFLPWAIRKPCFFSPPMISVRIPEEIARESAMMGSRVITAAGEALNASGGDNTARIWDTATGKEILAVRGHRGAVRSAELPSLSRMPSLRCRLSGEPAIGAGMWRVPGARASRRSLARVSRRGPQAL